MLGCRFSFIKNVREKSTKCSLKTTVGVNIYIYIYIIYILYNIYIYMLYNIYIYLNLDRFSGRDDVSSGKVNFRSDTGQNLFLKNIRT